MKYHKRSNLQISRCNNKTSQEAVLFETRDKRSSMLDKTVATLISHYMHIQKNLPTKYDNHSKGNHYLVARPYSRRHISSHRIGSMQGRRKMHQSFQCFLLKWILCLEKHQANPKFLQACCIFLNTSQNKSLVKSYRIKKMQWSTWKVVWVSLFSFWRKSNLH